MKRPWPLLAGALVVGPAPAAHAYCPSYTASSSENNYNCGFEAQPGSDPSDAQWSDIFALVAQGPAGWGAMGPTASDLDFGCGGQKITAVFPCVLLKGIGAQESGWTQFCEPTQPPDQVGKSSRTIISFDCGYGVGQVTSGMHAGETPGFDQDRVAGEAIYNMATGARIFATKWNAASCVGTQDPNIVEHWYLAVWGYNGFSAINNPNNPNYDSARGVWDPQVGGAVPYQERVFGWVEHPLRDNWNPTPLAYPNPGEIGLDNFPGDISEPSCASPTNCVMGRPVTPASCAVDEDPGTTGGSGGDSTGGSSSGTAGTSSTASGGETGEATSGGSTGDLSSGTTGASSSGTDAASGPTDLPPGYGSETVGCGCTQGESPHGAALALWLILLASISRRSSGSGLRSPS